MALNWFWIRENRIDIFMKTGGTSPIEEALPQGTEP